MSSGKFLNEPTDATKKDNFSFSVDQSLTFHSTSKNVGYLVEHYHLQSLLRRYEDYQIVKSSWELPLGLFATCLIGSLGTKFQILGITPEIAFTVVLYTLTVVTFIWFCICLYKFYQANKDKNSLKTYEDIMQCLKNDIEGDNCT